MRRLYTALLFFRTESTQALRLRHSTAVNLVHLYASSERAFFCWPLCMGLRLLRLTNRQCSHIRTLEKAQRFPQQTDTLLLRLSSTPALYIRIVTRSAPRRSTGLPVEIQKNFCPSLLLRSLCAFARGASQRVKRPEVPVTRPIPGVVSPCVRRASAAATGA